MFPKGREKTKGSPGHFERPGLDSTLGPDPSWQSLGWGLTSEVVLVFGVDEIPVAPSWFFVRVIPDRVNSSPTLRQKTI